MNYLTAENLSKSYGDKILFEQITLYINKGDKIAFVAKNGTGKTSLLRMLSGVESPNINGNIKIHKDIRLGFLAQEPLFEHPRIREVVFDIQEPNIQAIFLYEKAMQNPEDTHLMEEALQSMEHFQAWDTEARIQQVLSKLCVPDLDSSIDTLSGGQQKRVALAKILIQNPDFLILDEPTNHLDVDMIEWLEKYLVKENITLFMVTHDRYFLERVCNQIIELDGGQLYKYTGNYAAFLDKKAAREATLASNVAKAKSLFRKELEWMRKQPKARGTKAKARVDTFYTIKKQASQKIDARQVELEIDMQRLGTKILEFHNVSKRYDNCHIVEKFSYKFQRRERVGIVGKNGVGKSTLLQMIMGKEVPSSGKIIIGDTVVFGYYAQQGLQLKTDKRVIEVVREIGEYIPLKKGKKLTAIQLLERFLFPKEMHFVYVSKLSGGERRRLFLLTILMSNPNFLILDEPTNDLDVVTLNVLENFLEDFPGCLIVVSHDRFFMDKLVHHLFILEGGGIIRDFNGNYRDYLEHKKAFLLESALRTQNAKKEGSSQKKETGLIEKQKLTYKEKLEYEQLEKDIMHLEKQKEALTLKFQNATLDFGEIEKMSNQLSDTMKQLEEKTDRWLELSEYV